MVVVRRASTLLTVTEKGMGKRSELDEYRVQHRGGRGIITLKRTDKTGAIVALKEVLPDDELMMITTKCIMIRVPVEGIRVSGRNTQGVKVMNLTPGDLLVDVARVVKEDEAANGEGDAEDEDGPRRGAKPTTAARRRRPRSAAPRRRRRRSKVVTAQDVRDAAAGLAGVAVRTPLRYVELLNAYLKLETLQPVGAFKLRGAYTAIRRLPAAARRGGVITYS